MRLDSLHDYADIIQQNIVSSPELSLDNVTAYTPDVDTTRPRKLLVKDLSVSVPKGDSLCIMGPSGCGKSSILRVIGGLWAAEKGTIHCPTTVGKDGIFFVPQQSYTTEATSNHR